MRQFDTPNNDMLAIFHVNDDTPATRDMALRATDEFKGRIFMRHVLLAATAFATTLISVPAFAQTVTFWQFSTNPNDIAAWEGIIEAFEASHEGIDVVMEIVPWSEQQQRLVTALTTGGLPDVSMLGNNVVAQFQAIGALAPLDDAFAAYDAEHGTDVAADIWPGDRGYYNLGGQWWASPIAVETRALYYRKDLFEAAGLTMPEQPTYDQIGEFAERLTDKSKEQYGICLRGKPGWGENMAFLGTLVNTHGGQWFDMDWQPQIDSQPWQQAITYYVDLMTKYGPPGAVSNGFNENQALFQTGKCAIWIDATSAAGRVYDPKQSEVADKIAFAPAPQAVTPAGSAWFWAWSLAIPSSSTKADVAKSFIAWATSRDYVKLVGENEGWVAVPPGTRLSTYALPEYQEAAPFAATVLASIEAADPAKPTKDPVPYTGIQYVTIPEFQGIGTVVGQQISAALAGQTSVEAALKAAQDYAAREMTRAGYPK